MVCRLRFRRQSDAGHVGHASRCAREGCRSVSRFSTYINRNSKVVNHIYTVDRSELPGPRNPTGTRTDVNISTRPTRVQITILRKSRTEW